MVCENCEDTSTLFSLKYADNEPRGLELKALSKKCHALALEFFNDPDGAKVRHIALNLKSLYH